MGKIIKVFNVIVAILPYLLQIVELFKKNKENFEDLLKKGDKEVIPPDREVSRNEIEIPDEVAEQPKPEKKK